MSKPSLPPAKQLAYAVGQLGWSTLINIIGLELVYVYLPPSNAGLPQLEGGDFVYTVDPAGMAAHAQQLRALGVDVIGSCCGSSPAHVSAISAALA